MSSVPDSPSILERIPIRWRLAGTSAVLTLLILLASSFVVGSLLTSRIKDDFLQTTRQAARTLASDTVVGIRDGNYEISGTSINDFAASQQARIRVLDLSGNVIAQTPGAPDLGLVLPGEADIEGYRVVSRVVPVVPRGHAVVQYARPMAELDRTTERVRLLLGFGVVGGALLALAAGLAIARRAMKPIDDLTEAAREVERSCDPGRTVPVPAADDELRKLALTLAAMLESLEGERRKTEASLTRQRQFVADASHELRTPLTALIANLDMVSEDVDTDTRESVEAAQRSAKRMSGLVADLLLLARSDSNSSEFERVDLAKLVAEVCEELTPLLGERKLSAKTAQVQVVGDTEQLRHAVRNLIGNAITHTQADSSILVSLECVAKDAVLIVKDNGPGFPDELQGQAFDRFVRGGGDSSRSSGLGLAIVKAVAESHQGSVSLDEKHSPGAKLVFTVPVSQD